MFNFLRRKTTQIKPQSKEEELAFLKSKNAFLERQLNLKKEIAKEKEKEKQLKKEAFTYTTAGKVLNLMGNIVENTKKNFNPPKKGKGGFRIMSAEEMWK